MVKSASKARQRNLMLAPFIQSLRKAGWKMEYDSVAGGGRTVEFSFFFGRRQVRVQLHDDGLFRASHMRYSDTARHRGVENTYPTIFKDVPGMWIAVEFERTRKPELGGKVTVEAHDLA